MLNDKGQEVPDDTPIVIRIKSRTISQFDEVRAFIRNELSQGAARSQLETLEEASDFDVDDDLFPVSPHEYDRDTEDADRETLNSFSRQEGLPEVSPPSGSPPLAATPRPEDTQPS